MTFLLVGIITGIFAGFFGVGGGIVMIPILIWAFGFSQHQAQGISLAALLLPVGIFGVWTYYKANPFPIKPALWIAFGILLGTYVGARGAQVVSPKSLRFAFGFLLVGAGVKLLFGK